MPSKTLLIVMDEHNRLVAACDASQSPPGTSARIRPRPGQRAFEIDVPHDLTGLHPVAFRERVIEIFAGPGAARPHVPPVRHRIRPK